jgi:hypothetical protein
MTSLSAPHCMPTRRGNTMLDGKIEGVGGRSHQLALGRLSKLRLIGDSLYAHVTCMPELPASRADAQVRQSCR